jgi:hypothetical protein
MMKRYNMEWAAQFNYRSRTSKPTHVCINTIHQEVSNHMVSELVLSDFKNNLVQITDSRTLQKLRDFPIHLNLCYFKNNTTENQWLSGPVSRIRPVWHLPRCSDKNSHPYPQADTGCRCHQTRMLSLLCLAICPKFWDHFLQSNQQVKIPFLYLNIWDTHILHRETSLKKRKEKRSK